MPEQPTTDEIVYRFTPQFEGAHLRNVPQRDLTQRDVDRLTGEQRRDAFAPHPLYGTPLYTEVGKEGGPPKWFVAKQEKAAAEGAVAPPMLAGETQKQYEERIAAEQAATEPGDGPATEDGDA